MNTNRINYNAQQKHKNMNGADEKEIRERAMNDPEVQEILRDPIIGSILKQMEQDPSAAKEFVDFNLCQNSNECEKQRYCLLAIYLDSLLYQILNNFV